MRTLLVGLTVLGLIALNAWMTYREHVNLHGKGCDCGRQ